MSRPRVGITCDLSRRDFPEPPHQRDRHVLMDAYVEAVRKAGGVPLLLPAVDESDALSFLEGIDALIISGGGHDLDPETFGEKRLPECGPDNPRRGGFELALSRAALGRDIPQLGICGGMQVLNVAAGGTLFQDISAQVPGALPHKPEDEKKATYAFHEVEVLSSHLEEIIGPGPHQVNSAHHQSVKDLAPGMRLAARSADGVVEAIEGPSHRFVLGVQWHPESMTVHGYGESRRAAHLFARLVDEARIFALEADARRGEVGSLEGA